VLDAIKALSESSQPERVWEALKRRCPELRTVSIEHQFDSGQGLPVADTKGWSRIENALLDYVLEQDCRP
jgi:hypothetical protein